MNRDSSGGGPATVPIAALRRFVQARAPEERCELCGLALGGEHPHLFDLESRKLLCSCDGCSILFSGRSGVRYRRVPRALRSWPDFVMTDDRWESLHVPIDLAFFFQRSPSGAVLALYPGAAGAIEAVIPLEAWQGLLEDNPVLKQLEPDVEALLVNRVGQAREYYGAPIDECYRLVGLIRKSWKGLSGGPELWLAIRRFFESLKERSSPGGRLHA